MHTNGSILTVDSATNVTYPKSCISPLPFNPSFSRHKDFAMPDRNNSDFGPAAFHHIIESIVDGNREMVEQFRIGNQEMALLRTEVKNLREELDPLMHTILGNGGPGVLTRLALIENESKLRDLHQDEKLEEFNERLDKEGAKRWQLITIAITSGFGLLVAAAGVAMHYIAKIK